MKKIAFLTCAFFVLFYAANAQQQGKKMMSAEDKAEKMVDKLEKALMLTDSQEDQLEDVFESSFQKMKTIQNANKGDRAAMKVALKKNWEETDMSVQKVLTPEQFTKYQEWQKQNPAHHEKCKCDKGEKSKKNRMHKMQSDESPTNN